MKTHLNRWDYLAQDIHDRAIRGWDKVETSDQTVLQDKVSEPVLPSVQEIKTEIIDVNPDSLPEVEDTRLPDVDLDQFSMRLNKIEKVEVVRIKSPYAVAKDGKQHSLKVSGEVVHEIEKDGENIKFRPSELISLLEDREGKLQGYPAHEKSKWQRFKKTLKINKPSEAIGKVLPIRLNENKNTGKQFLGYLY